MTNTATINAKPITWQTDDLTIGRVETILGSEFVASFFDAKDREKAINMAVALAHGAWTANERESYAAYRSLARLLGRKYEGA